MLSILLSIVIPGQKKKEKLSLSNCKVLLLPGIILLVAAELATCFVLNSRDSPSESFLPSYSDLDNNANHVCPVESNCADVGTYVYRLLSV